MDRNRMHEFRRAESMFELDHRKNRETRFFSKTRKYQYIAAVSASMGAFGLGCSLAWASPGIPSLESDPDWGKFQGGEKRIMASIPTLGAFCSGVLTGFLITRLGRKTTLLLISAPFVFGWLSIAYANSISMMFMGRFITGFCGGGFALAAPVFISEIAEPCIRGKLVCGFQIMITGGILFTYTFGAFFTWQWLSIISGLVPLVFLMLMLFMPESPVHHLWVDEKPEAEKALCVLRGAISENDIEPELTEMVEAVEAAKENPLHLRNIFEFEGMRTTIISFSLAIFQQLCGINGLIFYTVSIFDQAEIGIAPKISAIIVGVVQVCATIVCACLIDRVGRRIMLLMSYLAMAVCLGLLGTYYFLHQKTDLDMKSISWFPLAMFMLYIISFSLGSGPVPWVIMAEIIPLRLRGFGSALVTSFHWLFAFLVTYFFESLQSAVGPAWCYWGFSTICIVATLHVYLVVPETKGMSLCEIQRMLSRATTAIPANGDDDENFTARRHRRASR